MLALYLAVFLMCPPFAVAESYQVVSIEAGTPAPFEGILLSVDAAAKIMTEKKFEDAECDLRLNYELRLQEEGFILQLEYKDIEIASWKDKYESMMILKTTENDRLYALVTKQKPASGPLLVALGFGIGTLTSLGIFALSTEIVK